MSTKTAQLSAFVLLLNAALLSGCGGESKDAKLGEIFTNCQMNAHGAMEGSTSTLSDEQRFFTLGAAVEKCLLDSGLQPAKPADGFDCTENPRSPDDGKPFVKPNQRCWQHANKGGKS